MLGTFLIGRSALRVSAAMLFCAALMAADAALAARARTHARTHAPTPALDAQAVDAAQFSGVSGNGGLPPSDLKCSFGRIWVSASALEFVPKSVVCDQEGFMAESDVTKLLVPLTLRTDVPQDARDAIAAAIQGTPLSTDVWIYRAVVVILGLTVLGTVFGGLALVAVGHADPNMKLPDSIVAIGSAAIGALAGLLAPSPVTRT
jgi:hypothetical protein